MLRVSCKSPSARGLARVCKPSGYGPGTAPRSALAALPSLRSVLEKSPMHRRITPAMTAWLGQTQVRSVQRAW
jgi:hypothetical protein